MIENENRPEMRRIAKIMQNNDFFKIFASQYQKGIIGALGTVLEKSQPEKQSSKTPKPAASSKDKLSPTGAACKPTKAKKVDYNQLIMEHINSNNFYRKQLPKVFTDKGQPDHSSLLQEKLKNFAPVPLPMEIKRTMEHDKLIEDRTLHLERTAGRAGATSVPPPGRNNSNASTLKVSMKRRLSPVEDETYMRRLKQRNYGKWYLAPEDFSKKITSLNTELSNIQKLK